MSDFYRLHLHVEMVWGSNRMAGHDRAGEVDRPRFHTGRIL